MGGEQYQDKNVKKKGEDYTKQKREGRKRDRKERNGMEMRERVSWKF